MELLKSVIFILTITLIYHSDGLSAGLNSNFNICGLKCGLGINGAIPNACQYSKSSGTPSLRNRNSSLKLSQFFETLRGLLKYKENLLKQLLSR